MTISPTAPPGVAPAGVPLVEGDGAAAPCGDFLALIQAAMSQAAPAKAVEALAAAAQQAQEAQGEADALVGVGTPTDGTDGTDTAALSAEPGTSDPATAGTDAAPAVMVPPVMAALVAAAHAAPTVPTVPTAPAALVDPTASGHPDRSPSVESSGAAAPATQTQTLQGEPLGAGTQPNAQPNAQPVAPPTAQPTLQPTVQPATPIAGPIATATPAGPDTAQPAVQLDRVSAQVFGEVTSLASRGNGTHRITMTLNPESLGEVKVVMTVRDGAVHVRMAAGHEARTSLVEGSPELARLLEHAGATEARVVVRELPAQAVSATSGSAPSSSQTDTPGTPFQAGQGGERSTDQHARTRADHPATDGPDPSTPRPTRAPAQPVTGTRSAGVDLTM